MDWRRTVTAAATIALAVGSTALASGCDWSAFGYDASHSSSNPTERVIGVGNVDELAPDWTVTTGDDALPVLSPAIADGVVVTGTANAQDTPPYTGTISALDATTGDALWSHDVPFVPLPPAITGGLVYVGGSSLAAGSPATLTAYDLHTGARRWTAALAAPLHDPVSVAGGRIYAPTQEVPWDPTVPQQLMALDAATGRELWRAPVLSGTTGSPTVAGGVVVVAANDHEVMAFDARTGEPRWVGGALFSRSTVAAAYGRLYVSNRDATLQAHDPATGDELWFVELADPTARFRFVDTPAVSGGLVFAEVDSLPSGDRNGLVAVDAATGVERWFAPYSNFAAVTPVVANGVVYMQAGATVQAYDAATGALLTTLPYRATGLIVANGHLYLNVAGPSAGTPSSLVSLSPAPG